jgi:putative transposase
MPFLVLHVVFSFLLDLLHALRRSDPDKTIEVVLLRQQLRLYERQARQPRPSRWEKVVLATLAARLPTLSQVGLVFTPATLLRWHREIVTRRWTCDNRPKGGRPPVSATCVELLVRLARENPRWGYGKCPVQ